MICIESYAGVTCILWWLNQVTSSWHIAVYHGAVECSSIQFVISNSSAILRALQGTLWVKPSHFLANCSLTWCNAVFVPWVKLLGRLHCMYSAIHKFLSAVFFTAICNHCSAVLRNHYNVVICTVQCNFHLYECSAKVT